MNNTDALGCILSGSSGDFALLCRPDALGHDQIEILLGEVSNPKSLQDVQMSSAPTAGQHETLVLVPFQQIAERGYQCIEDDSPLLALKVLHQDCLPASEVLRRIPTIPITLTGRRFEPDDEEYARQVMSVIDEEIGAGEGSNFVIKRSFLADVQGDLLHSSLELFRRLLTKETGAYWTFLVRAGDRYFVGASPERHVSLRHGVAAMTPISGTYRYSARGPVISEVVNFLNDIKETDELYMVLDEELKMMARVCPAGGQVHGPFLREMSRLAHTEYVIEGRSDLDPRQILHETLLAPTITGSPLENACRVIARHEKRGRGFYGGIVALIGRDHSGSPALDSAILIRTAVIQGGASGGQLEAGVGATLVRGSSPASEVAETRAKAAGLLSALEGSARLTDVPAIRSALEDRNTAISRFWLADADTRAAPHTPLLGKRTLCIDAEDSFSSMLAHQLRAIGLTVDLSKMGEQPAFDAYDLVVMGPGPGDPRDLSDPRIAALSEAIGSLLQGETPFLAVCLSHQILCRHLGLKLERRATPNQGTQLEINLFGRTERVGFYNSFAAVAPRSGLKTPAGVEVIASPDPSTGEVHALRNPKFRSVQFHPESVLTQDGERVLADLICPLLDAQEVLTA